MKELFTSYEIAKELEKNGYDKKGFGYWYRKNGLTPTLTSCEYGTELETAVKRRRQFICKAPLIQQVKDWFRIEYGLYISIKRFHDKNFGVIHDYFLPDIYYSGGDENYYIELERTILAALKQIEQKKIIS